MQDTIPFESVSHTDFVFVVYELSWLEMVLGAAILVVAASLVLLWIRKRRHGQQHHSRTSGAQP